MKTLLPSGCYDLLPEQAAKERQIALELTTFFSNYGYEHISPSLLEYSDNLLAGRGAELSSNMLRVMDILENRVMAIRPDITLQISRIVSTSLKNAVRPLRLCYNGLILRAKGSKLRSDRQLNQAGIELIGVSSPQADAEIITIAARVLEKIGISKFTIDLNLPSLVAALLADEALSSEQVQSLYSALSHKNFTAIENINLRYKQTISELLRRSGSAEEVLTTFDKLDMPDSARALCDNLRLVAMQVARNKPAGCTINIDATESSGYAYHSGIGFTIFVPGLAYEIGRGGRYKIANEEAVGFTIYIETLRSLLPDLKKRKKILLAPDSSQNEIDNLQKESYITINYLPEFGDIRHQAKLLSCDFIMENNKLVAV